jgi:hypothetical protein
MNGKPRNPLDDFCNVPFSSDDPLVAGDHQQAQQRQQSQNTQQSQQHSFRGGTEHAGAAGATEGASATGNAERAERTAPTGDHDGMIAKPVYRAILRIARRFKRDGRCPDDTAVRMAFRSDERFSSLNQDEFRLVLLEALERTKSPLGTGPLAEALFTADARELPAIAERYSDPRLRRLVGLCNVLQEQAGSKPFYLAAVSVAEETGVRTATVNRWLRLLVRDGVLSRVNRGHSGKASEYRFVG